MRGGTSKLLMLLSSPFPLLHPRFARHSRIALASLHSAAALPLRHHISSSSTPRRPRLAFSLRAGDEMHTQTVESVPVLEGNSHPWPEWVRLVEHVGGYAERRDFGGVDDGDDSFSGFERLPEWFVRDVNACLAFSRERPEILRFLSRKDVEVIVKNGSPFLFKNALNSSRRMRSFLDGEDGDVLKSERAETVDVVRYLLGYVYNRLVLSEKHSNTTELVEASVRNLFSELVNASGATQASHSNMATYGQAPYGLDGSKRQPRQNIEMKRGDWICSKCKFMNFARNSRCLECDEGRPKRQLTGGEWECPQCDFFNYGRNMACLRCDCKRPEQMISIPPSPDANIGYDGKSSFEDVYTRSSSNKSEIERRLAENDEKAERWFSKVSQLGDSADLSSAIDDEDFPEIMPLRKGVNRFVVSTKKTPLERRLANENYKRNMVSDGSKEGTYSSSSMESPINRTLDRILGSSSATPGKGSDGSHQSSAREVNAAAGGDSKQRTDPGNVPFVPFPSDMFRKPQTEGQHSSGNISANTFEASRGDFASTSIESEKTDALLTDKSENLIGENSDNRSIGDLSERWSKKVAEVDDVKNLSSAMSDEDFPEIMPMRKGENRFVISKKKDRSLTSPQYKRRLAMEQSNNSNFVPFVPFPPDYFAKKDKQPESGNPTVKTETGSTVSAISGNVTESPANSAESKLHDLSYGAIVCDQHNVNQQGNGGSRPSTIDPFYGRSTNSTQSDNNAWNDKDETWKSKSFQVNNLDGINAAQTKNASSWNTNRESPPPSSWNSVNSDANSGISRRVDSNRMDTNQSSILPQTNSNNSQVGQFSSLGNYHGVYNAERSIQQAPNSQNKNEGWGGGFSGKSLEGSAVTEPDPLDMSEEAKAQRWFRRVAQITDISELSKIPDEDFPEIMPMRKGVNRFVVSKRKTPLERRLTSPQYRRNLPIVSSDPEKDANRGNA